ncbi:MAG: hypothetical protein LBJ12_09535 [Oscillospiraceae bacterium]|jgi:hypothetical protein|nr:hypothetical protein [Oscillospiraceae bacterium]
MEQTFKLRTDCRASENAQWDEVWNALQQLTVSKDAFLVLTEAVPNGPVAYMQACQENGSYHMEVQLVDAQGHTQNLYCVLPFSELTAIFENWFLRGQVPDTNRWIVMELGLVSEASNAQDARKNKIITMAIAVVAAMIIGLCCVYIVWDTFLRY